MFILKCVFSKKKNQLNTCGAIESADRVDQSVQYGNTYGEINPCYFANYSELLIWFSHKFAKNNASLKSVRFYALLFYENRKLFVQNSEIIINLHFTISGNSTLWKKCCFFSLFLVKHCIKSYPMLNGVLPYCNMLTMHLWLDRKRQQSGHEVNH